MNPETLIMLTKNMYPWLSDIATIENAENFLFSDPMVSDASVDEFACYLRDLYQY